MLEISPNGKITTAALAKQVGVSEAALYRHFPSKTKMYEGLIEFIEEAIFARSNQIASDNELNALDKCGRILELVLVFSERNPGLTRLLTGSALAGETERLHDRISKIFERIETQLKQILRTAELSEGLHFHLEISVTVNIWLSAAEGRIMQYTRSHFRVPPTRHWKEQWFCLATGVMAKQPQNEQEPA